MGLILLSRIEAIEGPAQHVMVALGELRHAQHARGTMRMRHEAASRGRGLRSSAGSVDKGDGAGRGHSSEGLAVVRS
jgi:hypothetical protein